jgi:hypothetical protein
MFPKPLRGTALLERRTRRRATVQAEEKIMREARRRDRGMCRVPTCGFKHLPTDVCHKHHRGAGGNASVSRTTKDTLIVLCRIHHGLFDAGDLAITPLTDADFSGPVVFAQRHRETGQWINLTEAKR